MDKKTIRHIIVTVKELVEDLMSSSDSDSSSISSCSINNGSNYSGCALNNTNSNAHSESDESNDDRTILSNYTINDASNHETPIKKRKIQKNTYTSIKNINTFMEITVPNMSEREFQRTFRMPREAFYSVLKLISPYLSCQGTSGRRTVDPNTQLLAVVWLLTNSESYRSVAKKFELPVGTVHAAFMRVVRALNQVSSMVIAWPDAKQRHVISSSFEKKTSLKGVVGVLDATFVKIKAPRERPISYVTNNGQYGITLQAICDHKRKFIDCFAGYPSSVVKNHVFYSSNIYINVVVDDAHKYFSPGEYVIADESYDCKTFCIPPYRSNPESRDKNPDHEWQCEFDHVHAKAKVTVDQAFCALFGRFQKLRDLEMTSLQLIAPTVIATCTLHNVCMDFAEEFAADYEQEGFDFLNDRSHTDENGAALLNSTYLEDNVNEEIVTEEQFRFRDDLAKSTLDSLNMSILPD